MEGRFLAFVQFFRFDKFGFVSFMIQRMHGFAGIFFICLLVRLVDFLYSF